MTAHTKTNTTTSDVFVDRIRPPVSPPAAISSYLS